MADGFNFDFSEVVSNLDFLEKNVNRGINKALRKSAEPLKERIEQNTKRSENGVHKYNEGHAADNVVMTNVKGGQTDEKYVEVGYNKKVAWRMYFVNFGTTYQKPQYIVEGSIKTEKSKVLEIQRQEVKGLMGL